ncbi:hypothetical protein BC835DRAFT_1378016 [Cytidiella melzeri]|nr:hypothetical protein BC835DRAFT_1378016 [Cytidiella melzeri]
MLYQSSIAVDTDVSTARKVVKRRKLESFSAEGPLSHPTSTSSPDVSFATDPLHAKIDVSTMACSSCHRVIARAGFSSVAAVVVSCVRCRKPTCVICSRKCEGVSLMPSTPPNPATRSMLCSRGPVQASRKTMPMRRLPLRVNVATTNQSDLSKNNATHSGQSTVVGTSWPQKHNLSIAISEAVAIVDPDPKGDGCSAGVEATFCKNCVKEDISRWALSVYPTSYSTTTRSSGSIACFGCLNCSRT